MGRRITTPPQPENWRIREAHRLLGEELVRLCQIRGGIEEKLRQLKEREKMIEARMKELKEQVKTAERGLED